MLIDLQNWIVDLTWAPRTGMDVVANCLRLRVAFAAVGAPVVLVRYLREDGQDGGATALETQLVDGIIPTPDEHLVIKHGLDAFAGTDLKAHLTDTEVTSVLIAGLSTAHGVASTAATALAQGYRVMIGSDATASGSDVEHDEALAGMWSAGALVLSTAQLLP